MAKRSRRRSVEDIAAEIEALQKELQQREEEEAMRIASIVQASGLAALGLPDNELRLALDQFVKSFRTGHNKLSASPQDQRPENADTLSASQTSPHEQ